MENPENTPEEPQYQYSDAAKAAYAAMGPTSPSADAPAEAEQPSAPRPVTPTPSSHFTPSDGPRHGEDIAAGAIAAAAQPKKHSYWWLVPVVIIFALFIILALSVGSCTNALLTAADTLSGGSYEVTTDSVAIIDLDAEITYDGSACSPEGFRDLLAEAEYNDHVKAIVLRVNSGGGTATAGEEMTVYLQECTKPVVVSCASTNASAAYMISSQADYIYTAKSSAVGAIGVAMQLTDYSGLMELLGIEVENITSSDSKDSTYGTRALTDEERETYQHQVDQINEMFIEFVAQGRGMTTDQVRALANGMTYTGVDAVANGLADAIGTEEDACDKAAQLAGLGADYDVVYLDNSTTTLSSLLGVSSSQSSTQSGLTSSSEELR